MEMDERKKTIIGLFYTLLVLVIEVFLVFASIKIGASWNLAGGAVIAFMLINIGFIIFLALLIFLYGNVYLPLRYNERLDFDDSFERFNESICRVVLKRNSE